MNFKNKTARWRNRYNFYTKIILPIYLKQIFSKVEFLRRRFFERRIKRYNKTNSITSKLLSVVTKTLMVIYVLFLIIMNLFIYHYLKLNADQIVAFNLFLILCYILIHYFVTKLISKRLDSEILKEVESIKDGIMYIKRGDFTKRIKPVQTNELNDIICFTNILLDKVENSIECEKAKTLIDPLTKCYNRRALEINFNYILKKSIRENKNFGLVILDLDKFKSVNDEFGHHIGDKVLKQFAKIMMSSIRDHDFSYRFGGEEFVVIFPDINKDTIISILKRLKHNVYYKIQKEVKEINRPISVSGGFVLSNKYDLSLGEELLSKMLSDADQLLYQAKSSGRNKILG